MATERTGSKDGPRTAASPPRPLDPLAALFSYLVPGLGQIYQGRVGKGVLFLVCVYTLFFYGMYLGTGTVALGAETFTVEGNVYLPHSPPHLTNPLGLHGFGADLYNRPQFLGQFWVGVVAWPALWHYSHADNSQPGAFLDEDGVRRDDNDRGHWLFGNFERAPSQRALNALHTAGDKRLDLGWVYTVIAGVLNIMIIYDALAGPAFLLPEKETLATPPPPRQPMEAAV